MAKCVRCRKSGIFLKLTDGLCDTCIAEIQANWISKQQCLSSVTEFPMCKPLNLPNLNITNVQNELTPNQYDAMREAESKWLDSYYDFDSISGIASIPVQKGLRCPFTSGVTGKLYYYLRKKAYAHEKGGNIDLALACLKKSVDLLRLEEYNFDRNEYYPFVRMLARNGYLEEAIAQKAVIDRFCDEQTRQLTRTAILQCNQIAQSLHTDLIIMDAHKSVCPECAKYQGRVYSISGKSSIFPKAPSFYYSGDVVHSGCNHTFIPYIHGVNNPNLEYTLSVHPLKDPKYGVNIVAFSNRPFIDDRSEECKRLVAATQQEKHACDDIILYEYQKWIDACTVEWLQKQFSDIAPKTVTGYRRMKTQNTKNYQVLKSLAAERGRDI